jgi:hypothetical protein
MARVRRFRLGNDVEWTVFDVVPKYSLAVTPNLIDGWLCFERGNERRRLRPIPDNWENLSEHDLARMLDQAQPEARMA